ncbi:MAG: sigma-54-dependent transcriptional regulator [Succinivibrio sp.]
MSNSQILIVDDDSQLREAIVDTLMLTGYVCLEASGGEEALEILSRKTIDMVISDIQMGAMDGHTLLNAIHEKYPQMPVLLMTAYANINGAVRAMRDGAIDYLSKPFAPEVLLNQVSRYVPVNKSTGGEPVFADPATAELLALAAKVASTDATVMITGPSGSGKEVLSRYVHDKSNRASGPFVAINCAAIPDSMLEATLFGYEKGAFTGAVQACPGKFEQAQGGTILLDEITEMDLGLQAKLLRVLQEKEVERLGSRKTISLDVRVIATSNRDLKQAVAEKKFREDLYYRLNVFPLRWLPLCKRPKDILPIAKFLLSKHASDSQLPIPELTDEAKVKLATYAWPGNVRELDNVMQRALILSANGKVEASSIILDEGNLEGAIAGNLSDFEGVEPVIAPLQENDTESASPLGDEAVRRQKIPTDLGGELKQQEYQIILDALIECRGSRQEVSEKLGISPRTLRYKIAKMREIGMIIPG